MDTNQLMKQLFHHQFGEMPLVVCAHSTYFRKSGLLVLLTSNWTQQIHRSVRIYISGLRRGDVCSPHFHGDTFEPLVEAILNSRKK